MGQVFNTSWLSRVLQKVKELGGFLRWAPWLQLVVLRTLIFSCSLMLRTPYLGAMEMQSGCVSKRERPSRPATIFYVGRKLCQCHPSTEAAGLGPELIPSGNCRSTHESRSKPLTGDGKTTHMDTMFKPEWKFSFKNVKYFEIMVFCLVFNAHFLL